MPSPLDTIPDTEILQIAKTLFDAVDANPAEYSLSAAQAAELNSKLTAANVSLKTHIATRAAARAAKRAKDADRRALVRVIRSMRNIAKAAGTPASSLEKMGIPRSPERAPNATVPRALVDTSQRFRHTIHWFDVSAPGVKRKPRGTIGAEIWVWIGDDAPGNEKDRKFLTIGTTPPTLIEHEAADIGKTAHYLVRWRMRNGETSAWGETASATITG